MARIKLPPEALSIPAALEDNLLPSFTPTTTTPDVTAAGLEKEIFMDHSVGSNSIINKPIHCVYTINRDASRKMI
jgi:hypothetical protein